MVEQRHEALARAEEKALHALETPSAPSHVRPCDLYLTVQPYFDTWHAWHIWFDHDQRTTAVMCVFWDRLFDRQRFLDPLMGLKHGWAEIPTLKTFHHAPPYEDLQRHANTILGAIPREPNDDRRGIVLDGTQMRLIIKLPLSDLSVHWNAGGFWWDLSDSCFELHQWLLTMPQVG